ncbi:hypothetical protein BCV71DRAFT_60186 [Rhizopus microsporus]|uniref:Uncharacterized protein n=1 Tax=Rhizopus microsporus TaxID=58291 RepID=A0A1X0RPN9_RHIZD|nr:hypothetical protein BCV71DRAFT_60186 [Rhizopus microsporus]
MVLWLSNASRSHSHGRANFDFTQHCGIYYRDPLLDAHYERQPTENPSFPKTLGIYGYLSICLLDTHVVVLRITFDHYKLPYALVL